MKRKDVTTDVQFDNPDDEYLPIRKCVCGKKFEHWEKSIGIYPDLAIPCDQCGRKLIFGATVHVYEVTE